MLAYLLFAVGLVLLLIGGDWLVKGAVGLAEKLGISPLIIGLTIVALGQPTTTTEMTRATPPRKNTRKLARSKC